MSNPGHSRSEASKDPYDGVSWMKNRGRKKKAVVTGVVNKPPVKPANPVPAPPPQPSPPPDTPSDVSYQSDTASDTELSPFPSPSQTPTQRHPTPSTSAASKPPANDTSVFVSNLPASITQKSFFSALTSTFPSLRTAEVSVFSQERRAMLRIPAAYGSLFESAEEIKKLSHRLGEPCAALVRRSTARPATTNRPSLSSFSVVVRGVDRTTTEADIKEALGFAGLRRSSLHPGDEDHRPKDRPTNHLDEGHHERRRHGAAAPARRTDCLWSGIRVPRHQGRPPAAPEPPRGQPAPAGESRSGQHPRQRGA
ncbi:lysine-specific demethylase 6B-like [Ischnura elegans]|uniref:lysine-specific demethylase 6B-like n=1 Tax=Ischnura elegans TaxID=197161 RepID=UPI001ED87FF0|nr:lysine-specific demethylase 6B-like [Ischnura elegans]XP_046405850.1 lysine-specific demethylase 6B-like [Ischnura elegans]